MMVLFMFVFGVVLGAFTSDFVFWLGKSSSVSDK